jgi:hypothetical protein
LSNSEFEKQAVEKFYFVGFYGSPVTSSTSELKTKLGNAVVISLHNTYPKE